MNSNRTIARFFSLTLVLTSMAAWTAPATACSRSRPFAFQELFAADAIVRATAMKTVSPATPGERTRMVVDSTVSFKVESVLRGNNVPETLVIDGELSNQDDYNDQKVPYTFVRPGGRRGNCYADQYKQGATFLLFLKKTPSGYTPYFSPLGPVNEQLRGPDDPWLLWVANYLRTHPAERQTAHD